MDIVVVTTSTSHSAATNLRNFLQGLEHDVTLVAEGSVDATNLDGYEIIIAIRYRDNQSQVAEHLRGYIAKGKWVAAGGLQAVSGTTSYNSIPVLMGMPGPEEVLGSAESPEQVVRTVNPITGNLDVGHTFEWLSGTEFSFDIPYDSTRGVRLSSLATRPGHSAIHLFSANDLGITPQQPGGCGIYFGCLYNRNAYGKDAAEIMQNILLARPGVISGQVKGVDGSPASRLIRAYLRDNGSLSAESESDLDNGDFTLETWQEGEHTVIALPNALDENALIFDRVTPEPRP